MPKVGGKRARVAVVGLLSLVMLVGLTGCGGGNGAKKVALRADLIVDKINGEHRFDPDKLEIPLNQDTTLTVLNRDKIVHNFTISFLNIDMDVQPGQRIDVKVPAVNQRPQAGFFTFYCKYHQAEGETGRIEFPR